MTIPCSRVYFEILAMKVWERVLDGRNLWDRTETPTGGVVR
jgi:hypothetical protein